MLLFDDDLSIIGLGIEGDSPGLGATTALPDGIHLRWLFKHERGFPWYGYYLLRRPAMLQPFEGFKIKSSISNALEGLVASFGQGNRDAAYVDLFSSDPIVTVGAKEGLAREFFERIGTAEQRLPNTTVIIRTSVAQRQLSFETFNAAFGLNLPTQLGTTTRQYDIYGLKLNLSDRLELRAPQSNSYRRMRLKIGFPIGGTDLTLTVSAMRQDTVVQEVSVTGRVGIVEEIVLESDYQSFTHVVCSHADAVVLNVEVAFVWSSQNWNVVDTLKPAYSQPIGLPITHPDYPISSGLEDPDTDRQVAAQRAFSTIGTSFPARVPAQAVPAQGSVDVQDGSPIVNGRGTNWTEAIEGLVIQINPDNIPHTILRVLSAESLILTRAYAGSFRTQANYSLNSDPFGQLYDTLIQLVEGGPDSVPMSHRALRLDYSTEGTASVLPGTTEVGVQGTAWSSHLAGLQIHFLLGQGELYYTPGSNMVQLAEMLPPNSGLFSPAVGAQREQVGNLLEIKGHAQTYVITAAIGGQFWIIDPPVPKAKNATGTRSSAGFQILERRSYVIERVESASLMHLTEPYQGRGRSADYRLRLAESDVTGSKVSRQRLLDMVTLGSFSPRIAQTLGLHVVDHPPKVDGNGNLFAYDYLLIADHQGFFQTRSVAAWANSEAGRSRLLSEASSSPTIDAAITYDHAIGPAAPLAPPEKPKAYRLSDASRLTARVGQPHESPLKALTGLNWDASSKTPNEAPVLYHVWRQLLTESDVLSVSQPGSADSYLQLTGQNSNAHPVMLTEESATADLPAKPSDWPRDIRYFDMVSRYGWYSYRLSGVDLFGRHSLLSEPAAWWSLSGGGLGSSPFDTRPAEQHPFAIQIIDETAPPSPTAVESQVLDPADPYLERDASLIAWRDALPSAVRDEALGLRVRWRWTQAHVQQAPDTSHFQICYHPHRLNVLLGKITQVDADGRDHVRVTTDLTLSGSARSLEGSRLRIGERAYRIVPWVRSQNTPLQLRLATVGIDRLGPAVGDTFSLKLTPKNSLLYTDYADAAQWMHSSFHQVPIDAFTAEILQPRRDAMGQPLTGSNGSMQGFLTLPLFVDLSMVRPGADYVYLPDAVEEKYYRIVQILSAAPPLQGHQLWLVGRPQITVAAVRWEIGTYERTYELLLPAANDISPFDLQLNPTATDPVAYGHVGVTAHDAKDQVSPVSAPAKVYRVHRTPPEPPPLVLATEDNIYASPADYYGYSYYTVEWPVKAGHSVHVFRALDDAVFKRDRAIRSTRSQLDPTNSSHQRYFSAGLSATRQTEIAQQLNALNRLADYTALSTEALQVVLRLPGNETIVAVDKGALQAQRDKLAARDWHLRQVYKQLAADSDAIFQGWPLGERQVIAAALNAIDPTASDAYQSLSNRALQTLASLPGQTASFTQITTQAVLAPIGNYRDRLSGKSRNRFFYRVVYVDAGQNRSVLSIATPPIYLPKGPPLAPQIMKHECADGAITLTWAALRTLERVTYHIYRTEDEHRSRDIRLMAHQHTESVIAKPPGRFVWTDVDVHGGLTYHYRMTAEDALGNISRPSPTQTITAVDRRSPNPAVWLDATWVILSGPENLEQPWQSSGGAIPSGGHPAVKLVWQGIVPGESFLVSRQSPGSSLWQPIAPPEPYIKASLNTYTTYDRDANPKNFYTYRIGTISMTGTAPEDFRTVAVKFPFSTS